MHVHERTQAVAISRVFIESDRGIEIVLREVEFALVQVRLTSVNIDGCVRGFITCGRVKIGNCVILSLQLPLRDSPLGVARGETAVGQRVVRTGLLGMFRMIDPARFRKCNGFIAFLDGLLVLIEMTKSLGPV